MKKCKVIHYPENCIGCNSCVENAPEQWVMDEANGKAVLQQAVTKKGVRIAELYDEGSVEANVNAALYCPMGIIKVLDENGKEIEG